MLNRLRRAWELSKYDPEDLDLTERVLEAEGKKPKGEPNGAFLEDMSEQEYTEWERDNQGGWKKLKERLKDVLNPKTDHDLSPPGK